MVYGDIINKELKMNYDDYQGVNIVSQFNKETIKVINKFLKNNGLETFSSKQLKLIESLHKYDDELNIRHLDGYIRGDINHRVYSDIEHDYAYSIILRTGKSDSDMLLVDKDNNPVAIEFDFCLE